MDSEKKDEDLTPAASYSPSDASKALFLNYCGIKDPVVLRERAAKIQESALKVFPYQCIKKFRYIITHFVYVVH